MTSFTVAITITLGLMFVGMVLLICILEPIIGVFVGSFLFIWLCTDLWMKYRS